MIEVFALLPDGRVVELTEYASGTLKFSSVAVGGFSSCSLTLPGPLARWRRELPQLSILRVVEGPRVLWEGQLEDKNQRLGDTEVQAFGLLRRLEQTSVQRVWSLRLIDWKDTPTSTSVPTSHTNTGDGSWSFGQIDISDLTRIGARLTPSGGLSQASPTQCRVARILSPSTSTITYQRVLGTLTVSGTFTSFGYKMLISDQGADRSAAQTASGNFDVALVNATTVYLGYWFDGSGSPGSPGNIDFTNVRVIGFTAAEDAAGGFYGGTILRDLIALVPELVVGMIENGSDFVIENLERSVRSNAQSVVDEVAGYYGRRWGVWDSPTPGVGQFDWKTKDATEPDWVVDVADLNDLTLRETVDNLVRTIYLSYVDATSLLSQSVSATSTDKRNPFVRRGLTKDAVAQVSFLMTANSAQQLANKLVQDQGGFPVIQGTVSLPGSLLLTGTRGTPIRAYAVRAGDSVYISGLPKTEATRQGRDGESLFVIASTEYDAATGIVTFSVEGYQRYSDVLLARLAAVTRTVTG